MGKRYAPIELHDGPRRKFKWKRVAPLLGLALVAIGGISLIQMPLYEDEMARGNASAAMVIIGLVMIAAYYLSPLKKGRFPLGPDLGAVIVPPADHPLFLLPWAE